MFRDKKHLFLTYPRCSLTKAEMFSQLTNFLGANMLSYCIAQETHKEATVEQIIDGLDKHLHVYIKLNKVLKQTKTDIFDFKGFHPNIQACKSVRNVLRYLQKEDKDPLTNIEDIDEFVLDKKEEK